MVERHVVREKMKALGLSSRSIGDELGVSARYVRNVLCGSLTSRKLLNRIATRLGLSPEPDFGFVSLYPGESECGDFPEYGIMIVPKCFAPLLVKALRMAETGEVPSGHLLHLNFTEDEASIRISKKKAAPAAWRNSK